MTYYGPSNRLSRMVMEKVENDNYLNSLDRTQWYKIATIDHLVDLKYKFLELNEDVETKKFIEDCYEKSEWFITQLFHSIIMSCLKWCMAITSINGLLQRGSMFVFSTEQFSQLIDFQGNYGGVKLTNLLDLGAGDGMVTAKMAPFFEKVYTTEMSWTMQWRLQQKGFKVVDVNDWDKVLDESRSSRVESFAESDVENSASQKYLKYDVISCLNLLDRCDKPISMLKKMKNSLTKNGLLVVALVLPFKPYVEYNKSNRPDEQLFETYDPENRKTITIPESIVDRLNSVDDYTNNMTMHGATKTCKMSKIATQIEYLMENVFGPVGFELVRFSKLPYLCEGNLSQSFFYMFDYVFVFKSV